MKRILHVIASPRGDASRTLRVSRAFLGALRERHPACDIDELNVWTDEIPALTVPVVRGKYVLMGGGDLDGPLGELWAGVIRHIERFLSADAWLVSTPMWNFNIPYRLKQYIDVIVQPKYLFRYTATGVEGLAGGRRMVVVASRGGDYRPGTPFHPFDMQEPYLRTVFGFVGVTDITFIVAQPMDASGPEVAEEEIRKAQALARETALSF
ncbi:MAG: NAD(P)H-dependent oxidoreductase [bacterium]|nr:NAD(P)H-dependent oxidoreductase [bacterium]